MAIVTSEALGGGVARVRLSRDDDDTALSRSVLERLVKIFDELVTREDLRAILLSVDGDSLSGIAPTDERARLQDEEALSPSELLQRVCQTIASCQVPIIAAAWGRVVGGRFELVLTSHIRFAAKDATFRLAEANPDVIHIPKEIQRAMRLKGRGHTVAMISNGEAITADEALAAGLINRVVAQDQMLSAAEALAREIAALAPLAIRACLESVMRGSEMSLEDGLELEARLFSGLFGTEDMREGTRAFFEERKPHFKSR